MSGELMQEINTPMKRDGYESTKRKPLGKRHEIQTSNASSVMQPRILSKTTKHSQANSKEQLVGIFTTTDALVLLENLINGEREFKPMDGQLIKLRDVVDSWN